MPSVQQVDPTIVDPTTVDYGYDPSVAEWSKFDTLDSSLYDGLSPWEKGLGWFKGQEPWKQAAMIGGTGYLASEALKKPQEQAELEPDEIVAFPRLDPIPLQEPIQPLTEEQILAAYSGPSGTGIDTWFRPQVAKEGGLVELSSGSRGIVTGKPCIYSSSRWT